MKKLHLVIIALLGTLLVILNIKYSHKKTIQQTDSLLTIKLNFVGDLMCHIPQFEYARIGKDSFDFKPYFEEIKKYLSDADATFGNLETVIGRSNIGFTGYPNFNSPKEYIEALHYSGFDYLFTSNNHSADKGVKGIISTIEIVKLHNMIPLGTNLSQASRDSVKIINIKGIKIGVNSYTYGLNGNIVPKGSEYLVNIIDTAVIRSDIQKIKKQKANLVLIYFHFGEEYMREPNIYQKEIVSKTFEYGADIIIASHPHVIQPIEYFSKQSGNLSKGLIAYSLGNFFSNQQCRYSDAGVILCIEITKNVLRDSLWIDDVSLIPTWVFKGKISGKDTYRIIPSDTSTIKPLPSYLTENDIRKMNESFFDTRKMFLIK